MRDAPLETWECTPKLFIGSYHRHDICIEREDDAQSWSAVVTKEGAVVADTQFAAGASLTEVIKEVCRGIA